ncbi:MAG: LuxR C-terminal-related transcriptional regulator [Bacillota bacterium]
MSRPRLTAALTGALARPVTVVIAPAGFGKTTLLSEWRETPGGRRWPLAWLALEPSDSEPQRFWTYVAAALRTVPALGRNSEFAGDMLATFMGVPHPTPEQFLTQLINDILASEEPFVLVLDDYHLAAGEAVNAAMAFLLDHLPPAMRVIILTRAEPDLPLGHLRGRGLLSELTGGDLRFSLDESEAFLNGTMGSGLAFDEVRTLQERTEGWVAGLQMAALSLRGHQDRREAVASFAGDNRHIADYFIDEVLTKQPSDILEFLRRTAILDRLCDPLCDAVAGVSGSQEILEHLERSNLFLTSMDDERRWYRYHGLLARMLRARLERDQPDLMRELHLRASCWFEEQGFALEAVNHATAAKDYARVADIAERNGPGWWASTTYAGVHLRFPPEVTMERPTFCLSQGWRYTVQGRLGEAIRLYDRAEQLLTASGRSHPDAEAMLRFVALVRKYIAELSGGTYKLTDSDYRATSAIPEESVGMRNSADLVLAFIAQMEGELERSAEILLSATERELRLHSTITIPLAISRLARIRLVQGRLGDAEAALSRHLDTIDALGRRRFYLNGNLHAVMADVLCERNHLAEAARQADEGIAGNEAWGIPHAISMSYHSKARVLAAQGDVDGALSLIDREEQGSIGRILMSDVVSDRQALRVRLYLAKGDLPSAERWARESGLSPEDELSFRRESRHIALARVMIGSGRSSDAVPFLSRLAAAAKRGGRMGRLLEILVLTAVAQAGTDTDGAARTMARALTLAEPEGYVRSFTGEGKQALDLLRLVASIGSAPGRYAQRLLAGRAAPQAVAAEVPVLPEPLSAREMEILGLLAAGHSNRDIAQTLYLTVGTVKTHVHNLLAKLEVESRTQAIARAHDLGLLGK